MPAASRTFFGMVTWPLTVTVVAMTAPYYFFEK
jgi:hypothetical protein